MSGPTRDSMSDQGQAMDMEDGDGQGGAMDIDEELQRLESMTQ